jgi:hypothetical protein
MKVKPRKASRMQIRIEYVFGMHMVCPVIGAIFAIAFDARSTVTRTDTKPPRVGFIGNCHMNNMETFLNLIEKLAKPHDL